LAIGLRRLPTGAQDAIPPHVAGSFPGLLLRQQIHCALDRNASDTGAPVHPIVIIEQGVLLSAHSGKIGA
jgi:hypothetical protein